ncbi:thioredoxin family protein [soil metagenome]
MKAKLLLTLLTSLGASALFAAESPQVGASAPDFSLMDTKGSMRSLADYKGKYVVLEWFNPECPFVKKHYGSGNMQNLQEEYAGKGVAWLSIDSSAPGKQGHLTAQTGEKMIADWKMSNTTLLLDPEGKAGEAYGAKNTPHMFVINPARKIVYQGAIDSKATANPADIKGATNYVKAALDETLAGKPVSNSNTKPYGCSVKYAQ